MREYSKPMMLDGFQKKVRAVWFFQPFSPNRWGWST